MGFSDNDIEDYLSKNNVNDHEKQAILSSDSSMKEMLRNPLLAMMCATFVSVKKLSQLESEQRLNMIFETLVDYYKEVCKRKPNYSETEYEKSLNAVAVYAAYQLAETIYYDICRAEYLAHFDDYKPDMKVISAFGWVKCTKAKLSLIETKTTFSFHHQTFAEYFAARFHSTSHINFNVIWSSPLIYFIYSISRELFFRRCSFLELIPIIISQDGIPCCALSVKELHQSLGKPQKIYLNHSWTLDQTNLWKFCEYFKEICFNLCNFGTFEHEKNNQNMIATKGYLQIETIEFCAKNYENVINLLSAINFRKPSRLKSLIFIVTFDFVSNDSLAINAANNIPVFHFHHDEIFIFFSTALFSKENIIFWLIIIEKLLEKIRRCTLKFWDSHYLDNLIQDDDERLIRISNKIGDQFFIINNG